MRTVDPEVGQTWVHKKRGIELRVEKLLSNGIYAHWGTTSGFLAHESLQRNYRYDRMEAREILAPFGWMYQEMYEDLVTRLENADDVELITIFLATEEISDRNCWWVIQAVKDEVRREARRLLNQRDPFQILHCSKMTAHVPHIWTRPRPVVRLAGELDNVAGRYYCRGRMTVEGGRRAPTVEVSLPAGYR